MSVGIAYCGLNCKTCPAYIAQKTDDQSLREETAKRWSGGGFTVQPEQINCNGCHATENTFFHCSQCSVRNCASIKGYNTCADCGDYPCNDKLEALWNQLQSPQAKNTLDSFRD
ncbi:MAG: DUF3795 domain-containing protein [Candidatus Heimdallarchaeota archaeon]|nr:DUF3795 domain-containing protein [Candidatus Heimdallarchaeota archaeon]